MPDDVGKSGDVGRLVGIGAFRSTPAPPAHMAAEWGNSVAPAPDAAHGRSPGAPDGGGVLGVLRRRRWRMLAVAAAVAVVSAAAYPHLPKRYEASALVLLRPTGQDGHGDWNRSVSAALDESGIQSEMDMLGSRAFAAEVMSRHGLVEDAEFNPSRRAENAWLQDRKRALSLAAAGALAALGLDPLAFGERAAQAGDEEREVQRRLLERLSVRRDRRSYVMKVGYWSADPDKAAAMSNTLVAAYLEGQLGRKRRAQQSVADSVGQRVAALGRQHEASESAVHKYLAESGLVDGSMQASLQQQLATLSAEVALAHSRAVGAQTRARSLTDLQRAGELDTAPDVMASPVVQHLRERLAGLSANVGGPSGIGPVSAPLPALNELRQSVGAEALRIMRSAQAESAVMQQREAALRAEVARVSAELTRRQIAERKLDALRREASADRTALEGAMARHKAELGRSEVLRPDAEVVALAEPPLRAAFPNAAMAAFGTLTMALFAAALSVAGPLLRLRRRPDSAADDARPSGGRSPAPPAPEGDAQREQPRRQGVAR